MSQARDKDGPYQDRRRVKLKKEEIVDSGRSKTLGATPSLFETCLGLDGTNAKNLSSPLIFCLGFLLPLFVSFV